MDGRGKAYVMDGSSFSRLEMPGALSTAGWDVNPSRLVVGVYTDAAPTMRRAMHRALGALETQPEVKARHLALAAASADEEIFTALDQAADAARARGAPAAAAELVDLAIGLGGDTPLRRIKSAENHFLAGNTAQAGTVIRVAAETMEPGILRSLASSQLATVLMYQNEHDEAVELLRQALDEGRFGRLVLGTVRVRWCRRQDYYDQDPWRGTWALDGGVLTNQASHHIDLLEWMMGEVESVYALATTALVRIETEDTAVVALKFKSGALGLIEATTAARPKDLEGSISILGEKGSVEIGGFAVNEMKVWRFEDPRPEDSEVVEKFSVNPPNVYGFGHQAYYEHVVDCISGERPHLVDGLEGRRSLELISAIYESVETGREVQMRFVPKLCRLGQTSGNGVTG